jgi:hypothetical protein
MTGPPAHLWAESQTPPASSLGTHSQQDTGLPLPSPAAAAAAAGLAQRPHADPAPAGQNPEPRACSALLLVVAALAAAVVAADDETVQQQRWARQGIGLKGRAEALSRGPRGPVC